MTTSVVFDAERLDFRCNRLILAAALVLFHSTHVCRAEPQPVRDRPAILHDVRRMELIFIRL